MTNMELIKSLEEIKTLKNLIAEAEERINAIKETVQEHMKESDTYDITAGIFHVTWNIVASDRFDTKAFKAANPAVYQAFMKHSETRRFDIH